MLSSNHVELPLEIGEVLETCGIISELDKILLLIHVNTCIVI